MVLPRACTGGLARQAEKHTQTPDIENHNVENTSLWRGRWEHQRGGRTPSYPFSPAEYLLYCTLGLLFCSSRITHVKLRSSPKTRSGWSRRLRHSQATFPNLSLLYPPSFESYMGRKSIVVFWVLANTGGALTLATPRPRHAGRGGKSQDARAGRPQEKSGWRDRRPAKPGTAALSPSKVNARLSGTGISGGIRSKPPRGTLRAAQNAFLNLHRIIRNLHGFALDPNESVLK